MLRVMAKQPKKGRPKGSGKDVVAFQVRLPAALGAALDAQVAESRRPKNTEVVIAIEEYLKRLGRWPVAGGDDAEGGA